MKKKLLSIILSISMILTAGVALAGCDLALPPIDPAYRNYQFMNIQTAYDKGFLDREDIKHIAYRGNGTVLEFIGEEGAEHEGWCCCLDTDMWNNHRLLDFTPSRVREPISSKAAAAAKNRFARNVFNPSWRQHGYSLRDIYNSLSVTGSVYNGVYLMIVTSYLWDYPAVIVDSMVSGIVWSHGYPAITVFAYVPANEVVLQHSSASFRVTVEGNSLRNNHDRVIISVEATARQSMRLELTSNAWRGAAEAIRWRLYDNGRIAPIFTVATDDWAEVQVRRGDIFTNKVTLTPEYFAACCCEYANLRGSFKIQIRGDWMPAGVWLCTGKVININLR